MAKVRCSPAATCAVGREEPHRLPACLPSAPPAATAMGTCRSSCAHSSSLEYYDAWGHKPIRSLYRPRNSDCSPRPEKTETKLWICARGCCSIRWKLDYAEFQSYLKYAAMSPYVVIQDKTRQCRCVICCGLPDTLPPPLEGWSDPLAQKRRSSSTDGSLTDDDEASP